MVNKIGFSIEPMFQSRCDPMIDELNGKVLDVASNEQDFLTFCLCIHVRHLHGRIDRRLKTIDCGAVAMCGQQALCELMLITNNHRSRQGEGPVAHLNVGRNVKDERDKCVLI